MSEDYATLLYLRPRRCCIYHSSAPPTPTLPSYTYTMHQYRRRAYLPSFLRKAVGMFRVLTMCMCRPSPSRISPVQTNSTNNATPTTRRFPQLLYIHRSFSGVQAFPKCGAIAFNGLDKFSLDNGPKRITSSITPTVGNGSSAREAHTPSYICILQCLSA